MKPVKIKKLWSLEGQNITDVHNNQWSVLDLIERTKNFPVMEIPLQHLCIDFSLSGIIVRQFVAHMKMVLESNLDYPVILDENGGVFDGRHRIAKALLEEKTVIKAVRFETDPSPVISGKKKNE